MLVAVVLLYQDNSGTEQPPDFTSGGTFAGDLADRGQTEITVATPVPRPTPKSRSSATLRAPKTNERLQADDGPPFPVLGRYVYDVDGTESASLFGSRTYPPEMTMTVHRTQQPDSTDPPLKSDELAFDLSFSEEHEEREIVAFRRSAIAFTFEAMSITIGARAQTSDVVYSPPMTQVPVPLEEDAAVKGTSTATSRETGEELRVEDWSVTVDGRQRIEIMGDQVDTYVIEVERQTQADSSERLTKTRKYWLDPLRVIWVQWEERTSWTQDTGLGSSTYTTNYTATLDRVEPL
jgi:hypothetical protein